MPVNVGAVRVPQFGGRVLISAPGSTGGGTYDSGLQFMDAMGYPRISFQLLGTFTGMTATFYGTMDPLVYQFYVANQGAWIGAQNAATLNGVTLPGATSWYTLGAPADQSGGGYASNPLTLASTYMESKQPWLAIRCVIAAAANSTGQCTAVGMAWA